ncbi:hypothetical protein [Flavobacterium rhizosphaerae]|uniref:DUF4829 domain-containing protein n=1 Tax=Flavobacterium rhizosphaerae TaxID=3163298 RepID=A0ABW8YXH4_9FLAO
MKAILIKLLLFPALAIIVSCNSKPSYAELENEVFQDIFPALVDSVCIDRRISWAIFDYYPGMESDSAKLAQSHKSLDIKIRRIKQDTANLVIAIADTLEAFDDYDAVKKEFEKRNLMPDTISPEKIKFDVAPYQGKTQYKFRYLSTFPDRYSIWGTNYDFNFAGVFSFSHIMFDTTKTFAVMEAGYMEGDLVGAGGVVFLEKRKGKWYIVEVINTWVS